jgi:hypothetical protein
MNQIGRNYRSHSIPLSIRVARNCPIKLNNLNNHNLLGMYQDPNRVHETGRGEANLAELHDEPPLGLDDAHEEREQHRVAPEYAPEYLKRNRIVLPIQPASRYG